MASAAAAENPVAFRVAQIRFHWKDQPEGITSVDFHPALPRLLTAGLDGSVKIWKFDEEAAHTAMLDDTDTLLSVFEFQTVLLATDERPVPNCARWSPLGSLIVAAYVSSDVVLWKPTTATSGYFDKADERSLNREHWGIHKTLKLPNEALDANFSPCARYVASCSINGSVFVHSTETGQILQHLTPDDAHQFDAQYISFDPLGQLVASFGGDRVLKFYSVVPKKHGMHLRPQSTVVKSQGTYNLFKAAPENSYRRASWSPDGALFACPQGWAREEDADFRDCVYLFSRADTGRPIAHLSTQGKSILGCRFAPFVLQPYGAPGAGEDSDAEELGTLLATADPLTLRQAYGAWGPLEYRYVLAVWTRESVTLYTSGCSAKVCRLYDLHYDIINDVNFTRDGRFVCVASNDGYITLARFRQPLGVVMRVQDGSGLLSKAVSFVTASFGDVAKGVESAITNPPTPTATGSAAGGAAVVVVKKKKQAKPEAAKVQSDTAAKSDATNLSSKRSRTPAPANGDATGTPVAPRQPPAEETAISADELAALMD
jgi:WD40 repeat protein